MTRWGASFTAGAALLLAACDGEPPGIVSEPVRIEFAEFLPVADVAGTVAAEEPPGVGWTLGAGSRAIFHFELPDAPALVGEGGELAGGARARLLVRVYGERPDRVVEASSFVEDLGDFAGEMVRVEVHCEGGESRDGACSWQSLRIEGTQVRASPTELARNRYNVFVILLDSLRQDHIEPYGATDVKTPRLAALARAGVTFENARANASWTRPSVAAMLTALPPPAHGVMTMADGLASGLPYLPEILQQAGYRTLAVSNNPHISGAYGFARGFDRMTELWNIEKADAFDQSDPEARAKDVWSRYIRPTVRGDEPFFVLLHEIDPHSPYEPPEPYRSEYLDDGGGRFDASLVALGWMREHPEAVTPEDVRRMSSLYRGEIAFMDRYVGWILDRLAGVELERPTLVVFASDHGEEFWEHRSVGHGHTVHEELLRVPLLLRLDGVLPPGRRVGADVTLADVAPTILDLLGLEVPVAMSGKSLLPMVAAPDDERLRRPALASAQHAPMQDSISLGDWKLIRNAGGRASAVALFDLASDPGETRDLASERPIVAAALGQRLRWNDRKAPSKPDTQEPAIDPGEFDAELRLRLKELGYVE